ncbi:ABC transporter ATP-binding protein [Oceanobacillus sp. Castelsardo]|uniref:ABC transporter ATP-binding protein n=1 Tax=Oceanobacillus sp. Castelsardo TaxID=1851204 RepID=UPI0008383F6B|nr:ABC transporter ATP-binding protein [Oceanobacillus sp. Castelsardo]
MRYVLSFLKPYKVSASIAISLMLMELAIELLLPLFLGIMINEGVINQNLEKITTWGGLMIGLALFSFIIGVLNSYYSTHVSFSYGYDLRQKLFEKIQSFSFKNLNQYPTSALVTRFTNDIRQVQNTVYMGLRIMAKAPLVVVGGVVMAFVVNARLALIFCISVPLLLFFLVFVFRFAGRMFMRVQKNVDGLNRVMQENLVGMRVIKAFLRRDYEQDRFDQANSDLANSTRSTFRFVEASTPVLFFVMNLSLVAIIWFGNVQITNGTTNVGEVVTIINYALRVAMMISMFSFLILTLSRTKASGDRIGEIFMVNVDITDSADTTENNAIHYGKVEFKNVSFQYPNHNKKVLRNISFTLQPGEKLAIIGSTGSGKTSLFQLMPRLYDVTSGDIYMDNKSILSYSFKQLRESIGYVPQTPLLFSGTIFDNIAWGKESVTKDEVIQAAKDAQIHQTIMGLPDQYDTKVGQKGVNLSGGQKQRISIARALVRKPKLLMLDDSTSALDLATEANLLNALQNYDCTILIITQKISTAANAEKILLLDDGEMLALGTHEEVLQTSELYQKIVESQFGKEYVDVY